MEKFWEREGYPTEEEYWMAKDAEAMAGMECGVDNIGLDPAFSSWGDFWRHVGML